MVCRCTGEAAGDEPAAHDSGGQEGGQGGEEAEDPHRWLPEQGRRPYQAAHRYVPLHDTKMSKTRRVILAGGQFFTL